MYGNDAEGTAGGTSNRASNCAYGGVGSLEPTAMERTLELLHTEASQVGGVDAPCDKAGSPTG